MKYCRTIQEKLVAAEALSAEEAEHLRVCPDCLRLQETHLCLEQEARFCRYINPLAERKSSSRMAPARPAWRRLYWALGLAAVLALVFVMIPRPAPDTSRLAEGLGELLEDVYRVTDGQESTQEHDFAGAGWLSLGWESADPAGDQYGWL